MKSKLKAYQIENGQVVECTAFSIRLNTVGASTKAEATLLFLGHLERIQKFGSPELHVKNGAYALAYSSGERFITVESGRLDRQSEGSTRVQSLCVASQEFRRDIPNDESFAYYASDSYVEASATARAESAGNP